MSRAGRRRAPMLTFVVAASSGSDLAPLLEDIDRTAAGHTHEVILALRRPWPEAPAGLRVEVLDSRSLGDRLDRAAALAQGTFIVFFDGSVRVPANWIEAALTAVRAPGMAAAGGPVLAEPSGYGQRVTALGQTSVVGGGREDHLTELAPAGLVQELSAANLIVRARDFRAVGGFQSPSPAAESVRLSYKLRRLLERTLAYWPDLAVTAPPPTPTAHLRAVARLARERGHLARRLPETTPVIPYALPTLFLLALLGSLPLALSWPPARLLPVLLVLTYLVEVVGLLRRPEQPSVRVAAAALVALVAATYSVAFAIGFLGSSLDEVSPRQGRTRPGVLVLNWRDVGHPWAGGAETYMHEVAKRWIAAGYDVGWIAGGYRGAVPVEVVDGIHVHRVGGRYTLYLRAALRYLFQLRGRYDVIVDCENGIPFFSPLFTRKPVVLLVHHVHQEVFRRELPAAIRWLPLWLEGTLMPIAYRSAQVVAVSPSTRAALVGRGFDAGRVHVIENGLDPLPAGDRPALQEARPALVHTGRLKPYKSVDVLLRAMPAVLKAHPRATLDVVGQGPDRTRLERLSWSLKLTQSVRFRGWIPNAERDLLLDRAWLAVCPSAFEGWGVSCIEASAHGLPVVAADVPGLRDSVLADRTGVLIEHGDSAALAQALIELIGDAPRRAELGNAGREWAARFTWDSTASRFLEVVDGARAGHPLAVAPAAPSAAPVDEPAAQVSAIVTTRDAARTLAGCLASLRAQTLPPVEVIVIDNGSRDGTVAIAERLADRVVSGGPERSAQRNLGARLASGDHLLFVDADMELEEGVVAGCAALGTEAAIIPEVSVGKGYWAGCRALERRCYQGDDDVEAARFFSAAAFAAAGGYDEAMLGGEDWDLSRRVAAGRRLPRSGARIIHQEGRLTLAQAVARKRYYAAGYLRFARKHGLATAARSHPLARRAFLRRWYLLAARPDLAVGVVILKLAEASGVALGMAAAAARPRPAHLPTGPG